MTRLWGGGEPIAVEADEQGVPLRFDWRNRRHSVQRVANCWRADVGWWSGRTWREYFRLQTDTGCLVEIYVDLLAGQWYLQRLYD